MCAFILLVHKENIKQAYQTAFNQTKIYGRRQKNNFFDGEREQIVLTAKTSFEKHIPFFFLWSKNRHHRSQWFSKIDSDEDYSRY